MRGLWIIVFICSSVAGQKLSVVAVKMDGKSMPVVPIFCATAYAEVDCDAHAAILTAVLARYPVERLGEWKFILVRTAEWKKVMKEIGGGPDTPAFSALQVRTTVFEDSLFAPTAKRQTYLLKAFKVEDMTEMLDLAVAHEQIGRAHV